MKEYKFEAEILNGDMGGAYVEFPYDVEKEFGAKRVRVICDIEGIEYRGSLARMGTDCHILIILKAIRNELNKDIGDTVCIVLREDKSERIVEVHPLLKAELSCKPSLKKSYEKLSFSKRKEINDSLFKAKKEETQAKRLQKFLSELS